MVTLIKNDHSLTITLQEEYRDELQAMLEEHGILYAFGEALEYYLCNGWRWVTDEDWHNNGCLTDAIALTDNFTTDVDDISTLYSVYIWDSPYCPITALLESGSIELRVHTLIEE